MAVDLVQIGARQVPHTDGNLNQPAPGLGSVKGGWQAHYGKIAVWGIGALLLAVPLGLAIGAAARGRANAAQPRSRIAGQRVT